MNKLILSALVVFLSFSCSLRPGSSVKSKWSEKDRNDYMQECVKGTEASMGKAKAKAYCTCTLEKIEAKYPRPEDALKIDMKEMVEIAKGCL